jgi:undecaprenyl-diphosphatase
MGPAQALDARLFLLINGLPHPRWLDALAHGLTMATNGGWLWALGVALARATGIRASDRALVQVVPAASVASWLVEHPIKAMFRRRRPFIHVVRALVIGKKPGGWSFPSGHTAASFAAALALGGVWPKWRALWFGAAGVVGFSRVYVGAHYPGDVLSGAAIGLVLGEVSRRAVTELLALRSSPPFGR